MGYNVTIKLQVNVRGRLEASDTHAVVVVVGGGGGGVVRLIEC